MSFAAPLGAVVAVCALSLVACVSDADRSAPHKLRAVATIGMITDMVRNIGGDHVQVTGLMGAGVDPHLYKASEGDVRRFGDADLVFYSGLHLEAKMAEVLERMKGRVRTVAVSDGIPRERLLTLPDSGGHQDPHVWFDVSLWMKAAERVRDALAEADPANAGAYHSNAAAYLARLKELDDYVREQAAIIPPGSRVLVTAHDAFHYFGKAYGLDVHGLQGVSTATEAGAKDVSELSAFLASRKVPAIFVETSVPRRNIDAVCEAVRARGHEIALGGELFSDAMGSPGTPEGTYEGMVRHNIDTIVKALKGR
jgi:manganese/zinc/iron transport system substrate-binding protein